MAQRVGRKPLALGHVDALAGSQRAKDRMRVFLRTLQGELTIPEGCQQLQLGESQFHQARHRWLQEAVTLLEPRPMGRPRKREESTELADALAAAQAETLQLREQLRGAEVREEVARILADPSGGSFKKTDEATSGPKPR